MELTNYLNSVITVYGNVHNPVALRARGAEIDGANDAYKQVERLSYENGVDIGTRENFKEVLESQIDTAIKENRPEYSDYIRSILKFLEFYYNRF